MSEINPGIYNPEISNVAKETGGNLASIDTVLDTIALNGVGERRYTVAIAYDANSNPEYVGEAVFGTLASQSLWRIKKIGYDSSNNPTGVKWADGNDNFDNKFDDRTLYSYS